MHPDIGRRAAAIALLFGLAAPGLGAVCGAVLAADPMECCRTSAGCRPASGLAEAQSCCDEQATSQSSLPAFPLPGCGSLPAVLPAALLAGVAVPSGDRLGADLRAAPLRLPPRDLVKLHSSYLI